MKFLALQREAKQMELNAIRDAKISAEKHKLDIAAKFQADRGHNILSQAQSRMEGTMISPVDRATALDRVRGVGEFGLVRQFPSPQTEVPVGRGFVLAQGGGGMPSFGGKRMFQPVAVKKKL